MVLRELLLFKVPLVLFLLTVVHLLDHDLEAFGAALPLLLLHLNLMRILFLWRGHLKACRVEQVVEAHTLTASAWLLGYRGDVMAA